MATIKFLCKNASCVTSARTKYNCKLLVVGGGAGGCSVAWRFARRLREHDIIVLEPSLTHYNQPLFALVGAGIKQFSDTHKPTECVLPSCVGWLRDSAEDFDPCNNTVHTRLGDSIAYENMVVALGVNSQFERIPGLKQALNSTDPVCTICSPQHCVKTWRLLQQFRGGHAVFTAPHCGAESSGAAQMIMYLADDYWRQNKIRPQTSITYVTGDGCIYEVPKYASALSRVAANRGINVHLNSELVGVTARGAEFLTECGASITLPYNLLHVTPPRSPLTCLWKSEELSDDLGYLDVCKYTLQHKRYANVYGLGDCVCTPNSKSAAAVSRQSFVVERNLVATMAGKQPQVKYDGYGACPILTSYRTGILAEFLYDKEVCETFPFDQSIERRFLYYMKKDILPYLYWKRLLKGKWNGPSTLRKIINPFKR